MRFLKSILESLADSALLNPHRRHGYLDGPVYSPFKFDLDSTYRAVKDSQRRLGFLDVKSIEHHLLVTQRYEILRKASYESNGLTIGESIEMARTAVLFVFEQYAEIYKEGNLDRSIVDLLSRATNVAADDLKDTYQRMLDRPADRWSGK